MLRLLPYHLLPRYVVRSLLLTSFSPRLTKINVGCFAGVLRSEILSELLATKLVENEFAAYVELRALMSSQDALSKRGFTIASYALRGYANFGSLGFQRGAVGARTFTRSSHCPNRTQRDDVWFHLDATSCRHCVRVVSINPPTYPRRLSIREC